MTTKRERMYQRIERHGRNLLALFPDATEQDPVKLCKKLRRYEGKLNRLTCDACNVYGGYEQMEMESPGILGKVSVLLGTERVWFNRDPRGYALKVDLAAGEHLYRDMGGHGIIAPDLTND